MLTIGALMLLSIIMLGVNRNNLNTSSILYDTKFGILATSLGTSIIEEANGKSFDLATADSADSILNHLTSPYNLGPATGEVYPNFNDVDDFNGFRDTIKNLRSAEFRINCKVYYVDPLVSGADKKVNYRTWHKKICVYVTSPTMNDGKDTVKLSSIYSYWYFIE
jgi:MSHA pilin protein MshD